ncbi:MAG: hypothetical protein AAB801_03310 [Patescibacteria group bacterium]
MPRREREVAVDKPSEKLGVIQSMEHAMLPEAARMLQTVQSEMPELLSKYLPRELELLNSASGLNGIPLNFGELALRTGVDRRILRRFYRDAMIHIWVDTIGNTDEQFSIDEILSTKREIRSKRRKITRVQPQNSVYSARREAAIRNWQNPEYRARAEIELQRLHESYLAKKRSSNA